MFPSVNWGIRLNGDDGTTKYLWQKLSGSSTLLSELASLDNVAYMGVVPGAAASYQYLTGFFDVSISNYSDHDYLPSMLSVGGSFCDLSASQSTTSIFAGVYRRTPDAGPVTPWVSSISIVLASGWWANGSVLQLFGDDLPIRPSAPAPPIIAYATPLKFTGDGFLVLPKVILKVDGNQILMCPAGEDDLLWLFEEESSASIFSFAEQWYCVEIFENSTSSSSASASSLSSLSSRSLSSRSSASSMSVSFSSLSSLSSASSLSSVSSSSSASDVSSSSASSLSSASSVSSASSESSSSVSSASSQSIQSSSSPSSLSSQSLSSLSSLSSASSASSQSSMSLSSASSPSSASSASSQSSSSSSSKSSQSASSASSNSSSSSQGYFKITFSSASNRYVDFGNHAAFQITGSISLSCWFVITTTPFGQAVVGRNSDVSGNDGGYLIQVASGNTVRWLLTGTGGAQVVTAAVTTNTLYHVVGTWDGTSGANGMKLYVNGSLSSQGTFTGGPIKNPTVSFLAGAYVLSTNVPGSFFTGSIDAIRLYNIDLNSTQVGDIYGSGKGLATAGSASANLKGWWKFDEGTGTTAIDSSSGGNNGTLTNSPTYGTAGIRG